MHQHSTHQKQFEGITRNLEKADLVFLRPILETWNRDRHTNEPDSEEIDSIIDRMKKSMQGKTDARYIVAIEQDKPIGVVGLKPLPEAMLPYAQTTKPAEAINAYVHADFRNGRGVGKGLFQGIETMARELGYEEILLNSGPRYKDTAWGFYNKRYGEPVGILKDFYGEGRDAPVWRRSLEG